MLVMKLMVEGLCLGALLVVVCAVGIRNGAIGMVHLYDKKVQDRVIQLGVTIREAIRRRGVRFRGLCIPAYMAYVLVCVYAVNGARGFLPGFWQGLVILSIMNLIDLFMGRGNRSMVDMIYPGIALETCQNACREVYAYRISDNLRNTSSRVEIWRGSREAYPKKGAALLREHIPAMTERVFPNMGHCQFLHERPKEYATRLDQSMR